VDDRAKAAGRQFDQVTAAGKNTVQDAQVRYAAAMENARDLNTKLVEMVRANAEAALEATVQIANAKSPTELAQAWSTHAARQFAMLGERADGGLAKIFRRPTLKL